MNRAIYMLSKLQGFIDRLRRRGVSKDPILKVAGVCRGPVLSGEIDDSLYGR